MSERRFGGEKDVRHSYMRMIFPSDLESDSESICAPMISISLFAESEKE